MPTSDDNFSTLFELLPIGAYRTDADSRQLRANKAMVRIFGFDSEQEMLSQVRAGGEGWYADPGRRAEFRARLEANGSVRNFESRMRRHGTGEIFWISENAHLVRDAQGRVLYHEGTVEDITDRVRAQEALQITLDHAGRGIARVDADGTVVLYNRRFLELLDLPESLLLTRPKMGDVIRFQEQRGDFGDNFELLDVSPLHSEDRRAQDASGLFATGTYLRRTHSGLVLEVATQTLPDGGMVRTYSDVTAYFNAQRDLAQKSRMLEITLDSMSQGIATIDASGRVVLSNRRHQELLNLPEGLMATQPTMEELVRFQIDRGDFGKDFSFVNAVARGYVAVGDKVEAIKGPETYMRQTTDGRTLEVKTRPLPDGGVVRTFTDMTDYVKTQQQLAEKTRSLEITLDSMSQGIATIDKDGHVNLWNRRFLELLGFDEALMATRPTLEQLLQVQIRRGDFGPDFSLVESPARGYVAQNVPPPIGPPTYMRQTPDGRWLEVLTRPLPDGGVVRAYTDMTDYALAQQALAGKEALVRTIVQNIPDMVWMKDRGGVYQLSNPAHRCRHNVTESEIVGHTSEQVFGADVAAVHAASDERAMSTDGTLLFEMVSDVGGQQRTFEVCKVAVRDESGDVIGVLGIGRDITTRKEAEAALITARDAAEAGNRAKAEFLANMSHEIRTPMNAVIGMSDLLLDTPLTAAQREFAETIRTSGDALLGLINDILDFSKIESGHLTLERVPVNLTDCVESALDLTSGAATRKGLDLLYWIDDEVPRSMLGDVTRLRQVFVNLISNAVKFTREGEVVVTLSRRTRDDGQALLQASVRDTGIGIPPDRMNRLFQVFSQVDTSTTREFGGTGLGLAICRRLVTLMGGRIWVESQPGQGSNFQFEIPCQTAPAGPSPYVSRKAAGLAGRRVLLVDDNATNRHILTLQTQRWGMVPQAAASGAEALAWIDAGQRFDAALLDVQMPGMDGYTLAAELRRRFSPAQLPLLVLTSLGAEGQVPGLGLAQSLTKPVKAQALLEALSNLFDAPPAPQLAPAPVPAETAQAPRLAQQFPLRLLLAEDNAVNQRVAALILSGLGYDIQVVENGQEAVERVLDAAQRGEPFDVVLMDVQMPVLDGLEATRRLRERMPGPRRPWIVAMTANAMEGDRDHGLAAGMDDYVTKPIRAVAVGEALQRAAAGLAARRRG